MILHDSIHLKAKPENVFQFFDTMDGSRYLGWHPDHILFQWVRGQSLQVGNMMYFEERIAGKALKKRVVLTRVVPNEHIEFAPTFWLMRLFLPRMLFRMEPEQDGCRFIAEVHLRMGPLAQRMHRRELAAIRQHMKEEGLNLRPLVEPREPPAPATAEAGPKSGLA